MHNKLNLINLYRDPFEIDEEFPPDAVDVVINSGGSKMFGVLYLAQGRGPHPTTVLLHGVPGTERNFDIAHAFRRIGMNTMVFHYRGSWGSEGCFSFGNVLEDVKAALEYVRSEEVAQRCRIDRENIFLAGNSMGGFAVLMSAAADPDIKACVAMVPFDFGAIGCTAREDKDALKFLEEMLGEFIEPLQGTTLEALLSELAVNCEKWSFVNNALQLSRHRLLLIGASEDKVAPPELHCRPLQHRLLSYNTGNFEYNVLASGHSFSEKRIQLTELMAGWLEKQI